MTDPAPKEQPKKFECSVCGKAARGLTFQGGHAYLGLCPDHWKEVRVYLNNAKLEAFA